MLRALVLENFKAFGTRQVIPLAPITLIFGKNSAGKSSIIQSLLLLKQTLAEPESGATVLVPKGDWVDLGGFRELINNHDVDRVLGIAVISDSTDYEAEIGSVLGARDLEIPTHVGSGYRFKFDLDERTISLDGVDCYWGDLGSPVFELARSEDPKAELLFQRIAVSRLRNRQRKRTSFSSFLSLAQPNRAHALWEKLFAASEPQRLAFARQLDLVAAQLETDDVLPSRSSRALELDYLLRAWVSNAAADGSSTPDKHREQMLSRWISEMRPRLRSYRPEQFLEDTVALAAGRFIGTRHFLPDELSRLPGPSPKRLNLGSVRQLLRTTSRDDGFPDLLGLSVTLASVLRSALDNLVYLGPLREYPERHYIFSGNVAREVGKSGRKLPDLLFKRSDLVRETNSILAEFKVGYSIQVHRVINQDIDDVFGLRLVDDQTSTSVSMLDVGFGISQVLPVIVQSMLSHGSVILIEQPEIHLHPRLQADLATLFARCIGEPRNNQFIVETHSEHLILRLQRLIRGGVLSPSDVCVLYVTRGEEGSECHKLEIDGEGDFVDAWPEGFFEEGYDEVFAGR